MIAGALPLSNLSSVGHGKRECCMCFSEIPRPVQMRRNNRFNPMALFDCRDSRTKDIIYFFPITLPT